MEKITENQPIIKIAGISHGPGYVVCGDGRTAAMIVYL